MQYLIKLKKTPMFLDNVTCVIVAEKYIYTHSLLKKLIIYINIYILNYVGILFCMYLTNVVKEVH